MEEKGCTCDICNGEKHNTIYLHSRCHIKSPTWTIYNFEENTLTVICAECSKPIGTFKLHDSEKERLNGV